MSISKELQMEVEMAHYRMSKNVFLSELKEIEGAVLISDNIIQDFFWNYSGLIDTEEPEKLVSQIEEFFTSRERAPAAYITPNTEPNDFDNILRERGFETQAQDAWMFYRGKKENLDTDRLEFKLAKKDEQISTFVEFFGKVYGGGEDEPYGELPTYYKKALERSFENELDPDEIRDFIAYLNGEPVGIGTLNFQDDFAGIYNVGIIPSERGKGLGTEVVEFLVKEAEKVGVDQIFLQTEKGSRNEEFFQKNGFKTDFTGKIMAKTDE